ncbi:hypothetical protein LCGC14_1834780 [marine sediment metagenome]|uniref:Uncharacterized protein n=1 Tax=marine sediment metagenome TaxID=412755 RepID=A0A0F9GF66_9ZZZZ
MPDETQEVLKELRDYCYAKTSRLGECVDNLFGQGHMEKAIKMEATLLKWNRWCIALDEVIPDDEQRTEAPDENTGS